MTAGIPRNWAIIFSFVAAFFLVDHGIRAYRILSEQTHLQRKKTDELERFRATYQAAEESKRKFDVAFKNIGSPRTVDALIKAINFQQYGVETDIDNIQVLNAKTVDSGGVAIGLDRACITTTVDAGDTLFLRAASYQALLAGLAQQRTARH
jgi:hypothetical protein